MELHECVDKVKEVLYDFQETIRNDVDICNEDISDYNEHFNFDVLTDEKLIEDLNKSNSNGISFEQQYNTISENINFHKKHLTRK